MGSLLAGRARERRLLQGAFESPQAALIAVYGRRRVGKTYLVREHFRDALCFELVGAYDVPLDVQLRNFPAALAAAKRSEQLQPPRDWTEAFQRLSAFLERQ